jgi:bifunctional ADP-heptose synthase (sugar kinase/adenylyltransferase)
MALFERDGPVTFVPIFGSDQIADVTGAGDTVISTFTTALSAGAPPARPPGWPISRAAWWS